SIENQSRKTVDQFLLDHPLQRSRSKLWIIAHISDQIHSFFGNFQEQSLCVQVLSYFLDLQTSYFLDFFQSQRQEHYPFIDPVEKLGSHIILQHFKNLEFSGFEYLTTVFVTDRPEVFKIFKDQFRSQVGCHDNNRIPEIGFPSFVVG